MTNILPKDENYEGVIIKTDRMSRVLINGNNFTVGAGDSVVAAMAYAMEEKLPREQQISLAMAMGAASVMQSGTQPPDAKTVFQLAGQVEFEKIR